MKMNITTMVQTMVIGRPNKATLSTAI